MSKPTTKVMMIIVLVIWLLLLVGILGQIPKPPDPATVTETKTTDPNTNNEPVKSP